MIISKDANYSGFNKKYVLINWFIIILIKKSPLQPNELVPEF